MLLGRRMRLPCPAVNLPVAYPCGNLSPEPNHTATGKPTGYHMTCHGVARQGEDGRTHHHFISLISLIRLLQASRPRKQHTAVTIKKNRSYPCGYLISFDKYLSCADNGSEKISKHLNSSKMLGCNGIYH